MYACINKVLLCTDSEVEKLKRAVDCLMVCNEEKDRHIEELGRVIKQYRHVEDMVGAAPSSRTRRGGLTTTPPHQGLLSQHSLAICTAVTTILSW